MSSILSFPAVLHNSRLASRLAHIQAAANDEFPLTTTTTAVLINKRSPKDQYEGKRWVRRKDNAHFTGNPHIVAATRKDYTVQPPHVRPTFPEPLPPYLPRTAKLPGTQIPHPDPLSANAGRFSLSLKGMRKALRRSGIRAELLVRHIENELTEWLWEGGALLNPDGDSLTWEMDVPNLVGRAKPVRESSTVLEITRTPLQLVWYIADDAFARYIVHCCARYHEVVSYSKDIAGYRLTYLLRPNVTRPDYRAPTTLDTPPVTDIDYSSHLESDIDLLSDLSEMGEDPNVEDPLHSDSPGAESDAFIVVPADRRSADMPGRGGEHAVHTGLSDDVDGPVSDQAGYAAVQSASLSITSTDLMARNSSGAVLPLQSNLTHRRTRDRSTSSPSCSPSRTMVRRRVPPVRRYEAPSSTVAALGAIRPLTFYDFLFT